MRAPTTTAENTAHRNAPTAPHAEKLPAIATIAVRSSTRAVASLSRLSPASIVTTRGAMPSRLAMPASDSARTAAASNAALIAPGLPIASVPTGMPPGICMIDSSESLPSSACVRIGTPNTGSGVIAAAMPGKWAAPPAPAMITLKPLSRAPRAKS